MIGIYKITNPKGKIYIGQSTKIKWRFKQYKNYLVSVKGQRKLYNSLKKYGPKNHIFEIIEECKIEELDNRELYWSNKFNSINEGLNCKLGNGKGLVSIETKQLMSRNIKGKKLGKSSKGSGRNKGFKHTKEHKHKLSLIKKGKTSNNKDKGKPVFQLNKQGKIIRKWKNVQELTKYFKVSDTCIYNILKGNNSRLNIILCR